ncbi:MAG: AMP-binding protein [Lactobacillales bacterium]|jgi:long-chain acyl-CoA synthetase|nr:AMP-binding protein [Lactobacillales bacterium]
MQINYSDLDKIALQNETKSVTYRELRENIAQAKPAGDFLRAENSFEFIYQFYALLEQGRIPRVLPIGHDEKEIIARDKQFTQLPEDTLLIGYTSGTTGLPKAYMRGKESWLIGYEATTQKEAPTLACFGPMSYSLSLFSLTQTLYFGQTFQFTKKFNVDHMIKLANTNSHIVFSIVPTMFEMFAERAIKLNQTINNRIEIYTTGSKLNPSNIQKLKTLIPNLKVFEYYGTSETSYVAGYEVTGTEPSNYVGELFPGVEIALAPGGQIQITSPQLFLGYLPNPLASQTLLMDDLGYLENNSLFLTGRASSIIKRGGEKIQAEEIERAILKLPGVSQVSVIGIPDHYYGQKVKARIVSSIKHTKIPKVDQIEYVDKLELTPNGKIKK